MLENKNKIKDVVIATTYQCNSRCSFCNIWRKKETYSCLPADYHNLPQNLKSVNLSGGEPFLRSDLADIVQVIKNRCPKASLIISTNGFCPHQIKEQIPVILKADPNIGIAVSLDGFKEVHEKLRGLPGGFDLSLESLHNLKQAGVKNIKLAFTLGPDNVAELPKIYLMAKQEGIEFSLAVQHSSDQYFSCLNDYRNQEDKMVEVLNWLISQELKSFSPKKWLRAYFAYGVKEFIQFNQRILPDYSGINSLFIDPHGQIFPSDVWSLKLGQLKEIKNWNDFAQKSQAKLEVATPPANWMICTARQAIKRNWLKTTLWITRHKI